MTTRTLTTTIYTLFLLAASVAGVPRAAGAQDAGVAAAYQASGDLETAGKYREALDALDALPDGARDDYVYHLRRGWLLYLAADHRASIEAYGDAIDAAPAAVEPRLGVMLPQMALMLWLDVVQAAEGAKRIDPNNYLACSREAYALYNLGRHAEAERAYRDVLALYPSDVEMRAGLGWSLLMQGDVDGAAAEFRAALEVAPRYAIARQGLEQAVADD